MTGRIPWRTRPARGGVGRRAVRRLERGNYPNRPYRITNTAAAPWLFTGTGLHDGGSVGNSGSRSTS